MYVPHPSQDQPDMTDSAKQSTITNIVTETERGRYTAHESNSSSKKGLKLKLKMADHQ